MVSKSVRFTLFFVVFSAAVAGIWAGRGKPTGLPPAEATAYKEISILYQRGAYDPLRKKCDQFVKHYPDSKGVENVSVIEGELMVKYGKWKEVGPFYRRLETKFPKSEAMDRYIFFQGLAFFYGADFKQASPIFEKCLKAYPNGQLVENAQYYLAMSHFLSNEYKKSLESCRDYFKKFPNGRFAGDMQYRLSFIDFNDKDIDQNDKIIRDLGNFLKEHPDDLSNGSMLCLMADTYKKKMDKAKSDVEAKTNEDLALSCFDQAVWTDSPDDVVQYALDSATKILQGRKDWKKIAELHGKFIKTKPNSSIALLSATWGANAYARDEKAAEAAELLADTLKARIGDPACEQVEFLIDELAKAMVPRKKAKDIDLKALDQQLVDLFNKTLGDPRNATAVARVYYARARLAQMLKRADLSNLYMKGIAMRNVKDPSVLSPALLAASGAILLKERDLDGAEAMFKYLDEHYPASTFADAAPVGLGHVALARKTPEKALLLFEAVIINQGAPKIKEATLGKLQALVDLDRLEPATKLALDMVENKMFRGETTAKAYLLLARIYRKQAAVEAGDKVREWLWKAYAVYQRVYIAYQSFPELCAEAYWQAYEILLELKEDGQAKETLKALKEHPKLRETAPQNKALKMPE